jgi:putative iron-dependent peroxidase
MEPQTGILPEPGAHALFLILDAETGHAAQAREIARVVAGVPRKAAAMTKADPRKKVACTVSFGSSFWDLISPEKRPLELHPFRAMTMDDRSAPSTGGDVFIHLVSQAKDLLFELAHALRAELGALVSVKEEISGFRYKDSRDLTGFIDGSENPKGKARAPAALIGDEEPAFSGGSYVFVQRYVHDLARWALLPVSEQEGIVGRTKKDSIELSDKKKPASSHVARTVVQENGQELKIVRHSFPYGDTSTAGLFFVAYARRLGIVETMLARMVGASGDNQHDRLLGFSRAVTGATFFAPSAPMLASFLKSGEPQRGLKRR